MLSLGSPRRTLGSPRRTLLPTPVNLVPSLPGLAPLSQSPSIPTRALIMTWQGADGTELCRSL